jgi:glucan phosphorylase
MGVCLNVETQMFDVQVKRIHGSKGQPLNIFSTVYKAEASPRRYSWVRSYKFAVYAQQNDRQLPVLIKQLGI